jgi:hypothetical protein
MGDCFVFGSALQTGGFLFDEIAHNSKEEFIPSPPY